MNKKNLIIISIIFIIVIIAKLIYFSTTKNSSPKNVKGPNSEINNNQIDLDAIAQMIINNSEINNGYLKYQCHYNEENCGEEFFYKWKIEDDMNYVAFLSNMDEDSWKNDPFNYSTEIFQVNIQNGNVYRQSPFDGYFEFIANIYK